MAVYKEFIIRDRILVVDLINIIRLVPEAHLKQWYIEEIEASGKLDQLDTTMLKLSHEVQQGSIGKKVELAYLLSILEHLESLDSLRILGGTINLNKLDFVNLESIYENSEYVIEFFDSTEWKFTSFNSEFIENIVTYFSPK